MKVLSANTPVFSEFQSDGSVKGYSVDFATALLDLAGIQANVTPLPFARLIQELDTGELMLATGIGRTAEREDKYFWIAPLTANVVGLYGKKTIDLDLLTAQNKTISVAVLRGDYRVELGRKYPQFVLHQFNTWNQAVDAVLKDRVDAVFFSDFGMAIFCQRNDMDCSTVSRQYSHNVLYSYVAMPKTDKNREYATNLVKEVGRLLKRPEYAEIKRRWLPVLEEYSPNVSEIEGVIVLGKTLVDDNSQPKPWVITNEEPLFSERNKRGELTGYAVDLVQSILVEAGIKTDILSAPWQRILIESAMKQDVLVFSLVRTVERENLFHWITPITQNAYSVFSKRGSSSTEVLSLEELPAGSRIAVLKGDFRQEIIKRAGYWAVPLESWKSAVLALDDGRADYLFFSDGGIDIICGDLGDICNSFTKLFTYQKATTYLAVSKKGTTPELVTKLIEASMTFKQSSQYKHLTEKWLADYATRTSLSLTEDEGVIVFGQTDY
ncbi:substrate-binding periplasmic protein [Alteromonas sp. A081]|uniref:substrate-binding periplasmic protein n=1 Tax=Alteromonas sp. A081 TaxID=3410269 RepID=UPI003B97F326